MLRETLNNNLNRYSAFRKHLGYSSANYSLCYLEEYCSFCIENYGDCEFLSKEMLDSWLKVRVFKKNKTQSNAISLIRGFARFLNSLGIAAYIPDDDYSLKNQIFKPLILSDDELQQIFEALDSLKPTVASPHRNIVLPVIFRMIYCCGLRPGEATRLKREDVNLVTGDVYIIKTKNNKDRHIIMSSDLKKLCIEYDKLAGNRTFFFEQNNNIPISTQWLRDQLTQAVQFSKLQFRQRPRVYDFRHNFATRNMMRWIDQKRDIYTLLPVLSAYMGHEKISHTLYYIHLMPDRLLKSSGIDWEKFNKLYED